MCAGIPFKEGLKWFSINQTFLETSNIDIGDMMVSQEGSEVLGIPNIVPIDINALLTQNWCSRYLLSPHDKVKKIWNGPTFSNIAFSSILLTLQYLENNLTYDDVINQCKLTWENWICSRIQPKDRPICTHSNHQHPSFWCLSVWCRSGYFDSSAVVRYKRHTRRRSCDTERICYWCSGSADQYSSAESMFGLSQQTYCSLQWGPNEDAFSYPKSHLTEYWRELYLQNNC